MPQKYRKSEAKDWARQNWHGLCNVIIPSYSSDLKRLNEAGIRHDVRRNIELGFWGALLVSEAATTDEEYIEFMEIAVDEARGKHNFLFHGCFDTVEDVVRLAREAERIGLDGVLLGHPPSFYPQSEKELYDYTEYVCGRTNLAVVGFAQPHWNFQRLHPSGYPPKVMVEAAKLENLVACKFEVGGITGHYDFWLAIRNLNVLYSDPMEANFPVSVELFGQQWSGTSGYEIFGGESPRLFKLLRAGKHDEAMQLYWRIDPVRQMRALLSAYMQGAHFINRSLWKYWAWLHGYNGGPMRQPVNKVSDAQMRQSREAMLRAGFKLEDERFADFFVGRHPN
jgi:dihydrodipicolinate synthase/N-acetylneuraminate lyase